ncbi:hypothetical protein MSAN_00080100 [Mycena sanguinolenta]|uniref:F-box domain-containing protein n=1 Tax=Mycena sanguinolenta TaxID=230812 RepID=A0A8H7DLE1_9AGAR|nr:hypothetical protein MSAN_00080100 [Mycena sanguinolenta]
MQHLDDEIALMRKALEKLTAERDALGAYVDAHNALLSPVRRLPRDIIEEIFMACLPTGRNCVMCAAEAPVILGRICSSWRAISFGTPKLWSRLHVVHPYSANSVLHKAKVAQRLEVADAWLKRSGNCPLSISLEGAIVHQNFIAEQDQFLKLFIPHASRWQNIYLSIPSAVLETLSHLTENDVPLLEGMKLALSSQHDDSLAWTSSGIFHAPNLSRFSISRSIITASSLPLRWVQLTDLDLMGPPLGAGHPQMSSFFGPQETPPRDLIIELLFLHILDLMCFGAPLLISEQFLSHLSLPKLRDFKLDGLEDPQDSAASADLLVSFLAASTCLETISIGSGTFSKSSLTNVLRGLPPTVCRLIIESRGRYSSARVALDDDILATLEGSTLCPALQVLVVSSASCEMSDEALLRFIISRMPTLRRVDIAFNREMQVDILPELQSFLENGLQISLAYTMPPPPNFSPWMGLPDVLPQI